MAENSKIEWCDHTFNPWIGCTKVNEGCKHCYAETLNQRYQWTEWGEEGQRHLTSQSNWKKPYAWNRKQRKLEELDPSAALLRPKVFCASLADVFDNHPSIKPLWHEKLWEMIRDTPYLTWLILTKRPQNIAGDFIFPPNMMLGVSATNQSEFNKMMAYVCDRPVKKFLSLEPLLGRVRLAPYWDQLDWVIVGGESGLHARPLIDLHAQKIHDDCNRWNIPYFFKQHGEWIPLTMVDWTKCQELNINLDDYPEDRFQTIPYMKVGKKLAGQIARTEIDYFFREFPTLVEKE